MNKESGFGVAQEIRRMRLNTEIAIVTSYGEARNDAFQYRPIGYVDKPATIEEVTRLLRLYIDFYSDCKRYIYVGRASEERRIAVNDVTYVEVRGRSIKIEMSIEGRKDEINTTGTISEYEEKLKSSGFVRCYRSILVNPHHIKAYNVVSKEFSMSTGTRLPVSRSYAVQAVTALQQGKERGRKAMSPTAFFKLCCVPVSVLKAFFADYMMASVLERRFVNKKRNCCFTPQVLGYAVVLCARLPFVTHENTVYVSIIKLAAYLVAVIFMYKGRVTLRLLMYAIHIFTMFTGEFLSINILGAFGLLYNGFFKNNFYLGMLMSELLSSFCVFAVGFAVRRIGKFPTEASCETQFREVSALPITVCFAVVFFCLLQYGFISPGPEVGCISLTLISALAAGIMLQLDVFSKMLKTQQYAADAVADAQRAQLELEKVRAAVSHGEAVQRLEHDMKNLLLLIHMLNERGDSGRIDAVIDRIETEIKAEADGGIQKKEHGACIPIEKFRTCIGSADSCAEDVHRGNGEFAANNEMELPVSRKYAEQAVTADNRAKNGGGNL